jgi:beta-D-xylosidase 4
VVEGGAKGLMCAYNSVNGVPCCASAFLNNTLRGTWNFTGYVTSDTDAVYNIFNNHHYVATAPEASALAIQAGTDIDSGNTYLDNLLPAVQQKLISIDAVNTALYHTLKLRFELGLFDPVDDQPYWNVTLDKVNTPESKAASLFSTLQSIVLLKNTNNALPLSRGKNIAVIGPHANATSGMTGNYLGQLCPGSETQSCIVSPFLAIQRANTKGTTTLVQGCTISGNDTSGFEAAITAAKSADVTILFLGMDTTVENEMHDRTSLDVPGVQLQLAQEIKDGTGKPVVVVFFNGGSLAIEWFAGNVDSIIEAFYPGFYGGSSIASVLFGDYNPGGKLPYTIYTAGYVAEVNMTSMDMSLPPGRTYKYYTGIPTYPFGYGLSYTQFTLTWTDPTTTALLSSLRDSVNYTVTVTNTGSVVGDEVVLAYFKPTNDAKIIKQLFGFQRVTLQPKEKVVLTFQVTRSVLQVGDENGNMVSLAGIHHVMFTDGVEQVLETDIEVIGETVIMERSYMF